MSRLLAVSLLLFLASCSEAEKIVTKTPKGYAKPRLISEVTWQEKADEALKLSELVTEEEPIAAYEAPAIPTPLWKARAPKKRFSKKSAQLSAKKRSRLKLLAARR